MTNRLCLDCGAFLNSDDLDLNPAGLWCVKHELARQAGIERSFTVRSTVETRAPASSQVRSGDERGMPWTAGDRDPHAYLAKPLPSPIADLERVRQVQTMRGPAI